MPDTITCPRCGTELTGPVAACPRCSAATGSSPTATRSLPADPPPASGLEAGSADRLPPPPAAPTRGAAADSTSGSGPHAPALPADPNLPARFGRFQVRRWVGEGTFSEVFLGHDPRLDREVALKVARPGALGTPRRVKRFVREARAAGNLRHPNIVPLYEIGEDGGKYFLVTAFIHGRTLGAVIEEARPAGGLPAPEAALLARRLAGALAYAHGEGVVHRDIKPENVMVDGRGEPHILDFGLAARADEEGEEKLTHVGVAVGTPAYMAPEQARADSTAVGPAADQYALGCTFYELLTGRTPFAGPPEVQFLLHQTQPPPPPRKWRPDVPKDLAAICLKCLEKDPRERYASAADLAADLDRYLRGEPVLARRQTLRYLAGKFVRRYRRPLAAAAGVLLLAVAGAAAAFVRINQERAEAVAAGQREQDERLKAEQALANLEKSRKEAEVVWKVVEQAYTSVNEDNIRHLPGLSPVHEELAQIRLDGMKQLSQLAPDDPTVRPKVARAHVILGQIGSRVGSFARAKENLLRGIELYAKLAAEQTDGREFRLHEMGARLQLARLYWDENRMADVRRALREALAWLEPEHTRTPDDPEVALLTGQAWGMLGGCLPPGTGQAERVALAERMARVFEQLIARGHRELDARLGLALARYRLVIARFDGKDQVRHLKGLAEVGLYDSAALKLAPDSAYGRTFPVFMHWDRATALRRLGKFKECLAETESSVTKSRELARDCPHDHDMAYLLSDSLSKYASDLRRLGRASDARAAYEEAVRVQEGALSRFPDRAFAVSQWIHRRNDLADFFESGPKVQGEIQAKQDLLQTLDGTIAKARGLTARFPDHHWVQVTYAKTLTNRGRYEAEAKRPDKAFPFFREAADVYRERILPDADRPDPENDVPAYLNALGSAAESAADRPDEVIRLSQLGLLVRDQCVARAAIDDLGRLLFMAGGAHRKAGRPADAAAAYQLSVDVRLPAYRAAPWHWYLQANIIAGYKALGELFQEMKDWKNEVLAHRGFIRFAAGDRDGLKVDQYTDPSRAADEAEALRLREYVGSINKVGMKRFTVPCDFNGIKYPFHVYISNVAWPKHPLADQARWLSEERGGLIPAEVMDSFARLHKIAHENKVSYQDLCVYALGTAAAEEKGKELLAENPDEKPGDTPATPGRDPLADLKAKLADLKTVLDNSPGDAKTKAEAAGVYREIGDRQLKAKLPREAAAMYAGSARLFEQLAAAQPKVTARQQDLAVTYLGLAKAYAAIKEFDAAYATLHRRLDVLDLLRAEAPSADGRAAVAECHAMLGEVAEIRGDLVEAVRCYVRAIRQGGPIGATKLAALLKLRPAAADVLPEDLAGVYAETKDKGNEFVKAFVAAVEAAQKAGTADGAVTPLAQLVSSAAGYRQAADASKAADRRAGYRAALAAEYEVRWALFRIDPKAHPYTQQTTVAAELARSYLDEQSADTAAAWADRAGTAVPAEALLKLGELIEKGKNTKADPSRAARYYFRGYYGRGMRLFLARQYAEALKDLEKLCQLPQARSDNFNTLGMCLGRLGRWDEAVTAYRRAYALDPSNRGHTLNLVEGLVIGGKSAEVAAFTARLARNVWSPPNPRDVWRDRVLMAGYRAIASRLLAADPAETPAEKALFELTSEPDRKVTGWSWEDLDGWLAKADLPDAKRQAIVRIVAELKGNPPERLTPFFPLAVGAKWVYARTSPDKPDLSLEDVTVEVVGKEAVNGVECYKLVRKPTEPSVEPTQAFVVRYDGVYVMSRGGKPLVSPYRVLALPPAEGVVWQAGGNKFGLTPAGRVEVPAGKYEDGWLVREAKQGEKGADDTPVGRTWYACGVGPVKLVTEQTADGQAGVVLTLKAFQLPKTGK